jgi:hypothetical protein
LSDVRRPDARSAGINRPDGVTRSFQVSRYKVEPEESSFARNLLPKADVRATLADEPKELRPEMARIVEAFTRARVRERLAGTGAGPDGTIVGPSSGSKCGRPDTDAGEEVALGVSQKVVCSYIRNASLIDISVRDFLCFD